MEPVTTVTTAWTIAKTAGEISKKLFELGKTLKDRDTKHHVDEIVDSIRDLKQRASELEDENRELRERLRFKSEEYQFRNPYWYHNANPEEALCPKCFVKGIAARISDKTRLCLVCARYST
jgi:hypothetical protein